MEVGRVPTHAGLLYRIRLSYLARHVGSVFRTDEGEKMSRFRTTTEQSVMRTCVEILKGERKRRTA